MAKKNTTGFYLIFDSLNNYTGLAINASAVADVYIDGSYRVVVNTFSGRDHVAIGAASSFEKAVDNQDKFLLELAEIRKNAK